MKVLGIDIGGSGIKGAPVSTKKGRLKEERRRIPTPEGARPQDVASVVARLAEEFSWSKRIGCGFPAVVRHGVAMTAANIDSAWVGVNVEELLSEATGCKVRVINDADAAGLAEMRYGAGRDCSGVVLVVTVGTGLGTALFTDGRLVPNTEFGHVQVEGKLADDWASDFAREKEGLSWEDWAARFDLYLRLLEGLIWPDRIIIGGGASKRIEHFSGYLSLRTQIVPAELKNEAGIIGAALAAEEME